MLRHEPQEFDDKSVFDGKVYTAHSQTFSKAVNAKMHGAKAVLLVNDVAAHPNDNDQLEKFGTTAGPANAGIEFGQVKAELAGKWLALAGKDLASVEAAIDKDLHPQSFALPATLHLEVDIDIRREVKTVHNVGAYLPGETSEYVIVGAHYDHLGLGEQFSMAPSLVGTVHPGADDNASGTAGVMELAHWFSREPKHARGILFLTFAGEELGLLGSSYYVNHPALPLNQAVAMINMDMIGRIRDRKVYVGGVGTGTTFAELLKEVGPHHDFEADVTERAGYGSSDHTSFTTKQVPVLFFFSGLHADYHKPSDTWDKIDAPECGALAGPDRRCNGSLAGRAGTAAIRASSRDPATARPGGLALRQGLRIRTRFRQYPGFHRASQRRPLRRYPARIARGQGGPSRRRHPHGIRRQAYPEPVRLYVCAPSQETWAGSTSKGTTRGPNN